MFALVKYCSVLSLSHDTVLRFDWLRTCNPHINWWACTLLVIVPGGHYIPIGLPCNYIVHVELAFLDSVYKEVDCDTVARFTLVHLVEPPDAMEACGTLARGKSRNA